MPLHKVTREDMWPVSTPQTTKLYGFKQELEKTLFISREALIVKPANAKKKHRPSITHDLPAKMFLDNVCIDFYGIENKTGTHTHSHYNATLDLLALTLHWFL